MLLPEPDSPTTAIDSLGWILRLRPLKTHSFFLLGYLNHTLRNSISPLNFSGTISLAELGISTALILDGKSMYPKIVFAAFLALPTSGPN